MLINTLSAFFAYTNLINALETGLILLVTWSMVYMLIPGKSVDSEPESIAVNPDNDIYMYLQSAWLGRETLLRAFLPFFIILNGTLMYADYRSNNGTYTIASWLTILVILAIPTMWWTIAVWRCSIGANRLWASIARLLTITVYYEAVLRLLIGYYYPTIWFNCQQLIIEYGDCV